jgi:ERCC4-related helicase
MEPIESLGLSANQWQFLAAPDQYVKASNRSGRELVPESTRRQFVTARDILERLNGSYREKALRGILLADDVGLGKTTVAALVAWVVASAGERRGVRILAPNDVMMRRWVEELHSHVSTLQECAPTLNVKANRVKVGRVGSLKAGSIQVVKHSYAASDFNLSCDLLIVDEAHRAKGENSAFSVALRRRKKHAQRVLILTATPFSIRLDELQRMLNLIGGEAARGPVRAFSRALDDLYSGNTARDREHVAKRLSAKAEAAVDAISLFVIRHGIDDLPREQQSFGSRADWSIDVAPARPEELELIFRIDRARRVAKDSGSSSSSAANDPRFYVGWRHFDAVNVSLQREAPTLAEPARALIENQLKAIEQLRKTVGIHSKLAATAAVVRSTIDQGEKVLLFCHHHATAQELTVHLASVLPKSTASQSPSPSTWHRAWDDVLPSASEERNEQALRDTFIEWLCANLIRAQTWSWIPARPGSDKTLVDALRTTKARHRLGKETIADAAQRLYHTLLQSKSSRAVLMAAADGHLEYIPGANGTSRVLGVCMPSDCAKEESLFIHNQQPDTVISIFNSPFGPDVLVVTDRLSEGIDLHRYCRHLIHYELDPSPIRTVQRNGRLRRVNSWAAATGREILYAYPSFRGTRDHRLVQIMKKRINSFSLLLGGVQDFDVDDILGSDEDWRNDVIAKAKKDLAAVGGRLRAKEPKGLSAS